MKKILKFATVFFLALVLVGAVGAHTAKASGLTSTQISAIIGLLQSFGADQSVINNVQTALTGTPTTPPTTTAWCHTFNTNLMVGSSGDDVAALQYILQQQGLLSNLYVFANSSVSFFSEQVAAAVVKFQAKYGINQTGYVGPLTRAKLNSLYGCGNSSLSVKDISISVDRPTINSGNSVNLTLISPSNTTNATINVQCLNGIFARSVRMSPINRCGITDVTIDSGYSSQSPNYSLAFTNSTSQTQTVTIEYHVRYSDRVVLWTSPCRVFYHKLKTLPAPPAKLGTVRRAYQPVAWLAVLIL